jgi:4-hydroxy-tetrahydrodipicolinate reductase
MGSVVVREAANRGFEVVGAIAAASDPQQGKTLRELGLCNSDVRVTDASGLKRKIEGVDVYVSFTLPDAELANIPVVASAEKRIVMGTTGFTDDQINKLRGAVVSSAVPAVFAPNFAIGVNFLSKMIKTLKALPKDYDVSIMEAHHSGKKDAPSGTAQSLAKLVSEIRGYDKTSYGRSGVSVRKPGEMEVVAIRAGGIPGIHNIIVAGPYDMISIEHLSFSRSVFAQGALYAAEWLTKQAKPGVYTMDDVLSS